VPEPADVTAAADELRRVWVASAAGAYACPRIGVILGSGLGGLTGRMQDARSCTMAELPGLPATGVDGHDGAFVLGRLETVPVIAQAGRYHAYEGHTPEVVVGPVRIMAALGVEVVIVTNAAGGVAPGLDPGDIVLLADQINLSFQAPLAGAARKDEARFPDMSAPFDAELRRRTLAVARGVGVALKEGVYAGVLGPSYETAAEVRMIHRLGGDVVGMSTVQEVIAARALGLRVIGLSLVTNRATRRGSPALSHADVLSAGKQAAHRLERLVSAMVAGLG